MHDRQWDLGSQDYAWRIAVLNGEELHAQKHVDSAFPSRVDVVVACAWF